jgi:hypothetical protein
LKPVSAKATEFSHVAQMPTTSQLFGLSPQEQAAATFTALGEAGPGKDLFGPYVTLLNRRMHGGYRKNVLEERFFVAEFEAKKT